MNRPLQFGIIRNNILSWDETIAQWQRFEAAGFDSCWTVDHFQRPSDPAGPHLDSWTILGAVAARTERIRLGVLVTCNTFRNPGLLAKQAVSVDHISHGRLEFGLGAGWFEEEHVRFGIRFPPGPERVAQFKESVELIDLLMRQDVTTYNGRFYQLEEAPFRPGPVQQPRPPFTLGAHGPRMLAIAARYADRWNSYGSLEEMQARNDELDRACGAIGRDPNEIIRSLYGHPSALVADPWSSHDAFRANVDHFRAAGINEFILEPPKAGQWEMMESIACDLLPELRDQVSSDR
jgi:F420-dependent oxidoreductase-like protein